MNLSKGQMFVLTMVFLMGMVFVVQQVLFTYSSVDFVSGVQTDDFYFIKSIRDSINETVTTVSDCSNLSRIMNEFEGFFRKHVMESGFVVSTDYELDCFNWNNIPPADPPVKVTVYIKGKGIDSSVGYDVYRTGISG